MGVEMFFISDNIQKMAKKWWQKTSTLSYLSIGSDDTHTEFTLGAKETQTFLTTFKSNLAEPPLADNSIFNMSKWPFWQAMKKGVEPVWFEYTLKLQETKLLLKRSKLMLIWG